MDKKVTPQYLGLGILLLRLGLAGVFLYASIDSTLHPEDWLYYIPDWVVGMVDGRFLLHSHAAFEFVLALWILSGRYVWLAALVAAADMVPLVVLNLDLMNIVFRDIGLFFASLALAALTFPAKLRNNN